MCVYGAAFEIGFRELTVLRSGQEFQPSVATCTFSNTWLLLSMTRTFVILIQTAAFLAIAGIAAGQDAQKSRASIGDEKPLAKLVQQLRSAEFSERQQALAELLKLPATQVSELEALQDQTDAASRQMLSDVLVRLRKRHFEDRLNLFLAKPSIEFAEGLPDWDRFQRIAGSHPELLTIFGEILDAERSLFSARVFRSRDLSEQLELRSREFSELCTGRETDTFPEAMCAALMLIGSDPAVNLRRLTSAHISDAMKDPRFTRLIQDSDRAEFWRTMLGEWINRPGIAVDRPLLFAAENTLEVGRDLARRTISGPARSQSRYYAMLCIAKLGHAEDLPLIESQLPSNRVLWPSRAVPGLSADYSVQTRDVAVAVALHLRGRTPEEFGMSVRRDDATVFDVTSLGFDSEASRNRILEQYRKEFAR
jgi:hypothetical protein